MIAGVEGQPVDRATSARQFVQHFYGWYVPLTTSTKGSPGWDIVLTRAQRDLSPDLYRALKADDIAQKKVTDDVVGLDFDPFLNTQDPYPHYKIGKITERNGMFIAEVRGSGSTSREPDVIAELSRQSGRWVFVDFLYPGTDDLLGVLKKLAKERASSSR
jgi:hypothetical protein